MKKFYLGNILHFGTDPNNPEWDTLISIYNGNQFPVEVELTIWNETTGALVPWPTGSPVHLINVEACSSFAFTFMPGNGFEAPPTNFLGHALITCPHDNVYVWSMLSGHNWDSSAPSIEAPIITELSQRNNWVFPYAIPKWSYTGHSGDEAYETGLSIQNFSPFPTKAIVWYTINQCYHEEVEKEFCSEELEIPANGGIRTLLSALLPSLPVRSEGHLVVTALPDARLYPSLIVATANFKFSAGMNFQI